MTAFAARRGSGSLARGAIRHAVVLSALFVIAAALGFVAGNAAPKETEKILALLAKEVAGVGDLSKVSLFILIFGSNAVKVFLAMTLGTFFGIVPVLFVGFNGLILGIIGTAVWGAEGARILLLGTIPHGIFELPGLILASAYGMLLGGAFWRKIHSRGAFKLALSFALQKFGMIVIPLLALASFIETFITAALLEAI